MSVRHFFERLMTMIVQVRSKKRYFKVNVKMICRKKKIERERTQVRLNEVSLSNFFVSFSNRRRWGGGRKMLKPIKSCLCRGMTWVHFCLSPGWESVCLCVCVCVCERERERERISECVCDWICVFAARKSTKICAWAFMCWKERESVCVKERWPMYVSVY